MDAEELAAILSVLLESEVICQNVSVPCGRHGVWCVRFEAAGSRGGVWEFHTPLTIAEVFSLDNVVSWLEDLLAALDCYTWVLGERLLTFKEILPGGVM